MVYEKPIAEIINLETENIMSSGGMGGGPSDITGGDGPTPFG